MDSFAKYFNHSLRFLSYRPRSEKEVRDNLLKKKIDTVTLEKVIARLHVHAFLDDEAFAKWWFERRSGSQPKGVRVIQMELRQKGIDKEIIERILGNEEHKTEARDALIRLIKKLIAKNTGLAQKELRQKVGMYVMRRGYDYEMAKHAIDEVLHDGV